ncbi:hypothetical protein, partial [Micromonospora sp. ALFpr18c]
MEATTLHGGLLAARHVLHADVAGGDLEAT